MTQDPDIVVVGGGLAGLAAAAYSARGGARVLLLEGSSRLGGRAITNLRGGYHFNIGPHALYRTGHASQVLAELGVTVSGGMPPLSGAFAYIDGALHTLPSGFVSLLTTGMLGAKGKFELGGFLKNLGDYRPEPLDNIPVDEWLARSMTDPMARRVAWAWIRTASYSANGDLYSAGAALRQLQQANGGVLYLDHGWQSMVQGLASCAERAGVRLESQRAVKRLEAQDGRINVVLADGSAIQASTAILACGPRTTAEIAGGLQPSLSEAAARVRPGRMACLDLGLRALPKPAHRFALGIDRQLYFSVHSSIARLAPEGGAFIHVAKYLGDAASDPKADRLELETFLDAMQPGWRQHVEQEQFLSSIAAVEAVPLASNGGLSGRPSVAIAAAQRVFLAGDWVGQEGQLSDASLASARRASGLALEAVGLPTALAHTA